MCGGTDCIDTTSNSNACGPSCMVCPSGTSCTNSKCGTVEYGYPTEFSPCGGSFSGVSSDYLFGESITIPATITVTALGLFGNNPAAGVHGVMALYGDSGGAPSGLKTDTSSTAIANGNNLIPVLSQVSVGPGTYWIFAEFDSLAAICSDSSTSNQWDYIPVTYGSAPNLFGTPMTTAGQANLNYYVVGTL
jgi:hypothetical protein